MSRSRCRALWLTTVIVAWLGLSLRSVHAEETYTLRGAVAPHATAARLLSRAAAEESLPMSLTLRLRHRDELDTLITEQQRPGSSQYHQWLSPQEFAARFAPPAAAYEEVAAWLEREGFTVRRWANRTRIDFSGPVWRVERAWKVRMNRYRHRGRTHIANAAAPRLPVRFADTVDFVRLNTFPLARPLVRIFGPGGLADTMAPRDLYTAYNVNPVLARGIDGSGQVIAVVARSDFNVSDVTQFQQQFGVTVRDPIKVFPAGNPGVGAVNGVCKDPFFQRECIEGEEGEVLLDTEWANALAPGASVLVDIADTDIDASLADVVSNHADAKIISISFGACERLDGSDRQIFAALYAQAAAQGQTVVVAAGDDGADDCQDGEAASVNVLASDANVTAVGGTALDPGFDAQGNATRYVSEEVWNDVGGASGGGTSILVPKPEYQMALSVLPGNFRGIPDVSLLASPSSAGYVMIFRGHVTIIGGTSAAAPNWAGIVALLNHAAVSGGSGALNPFLYALGQQQYAAAGAPVFHDVTVGDNSLDGVTGFSAAAGYDLATGLGTPDVSQLIRAAGCAGDCNGDHVVTVDEVLTVENIALGFAPAAQCPSFNTGPDARLTVAHVITATHRALNGCWPNTEGGGLF